MVSLGPQHHELLVDEECWRAVAQSLGGSGQCQANRPDAGLDVSHAWTIFGIGLINLRDRGRSSEIGAV